MTNETRTPSPIEPQPDDYSGAMVFDPGDGQDATNVSSGTPTLNETGHSYNEADHDGIMQPVDPADFDRELIDARGLLDELQRAWNDQCRERNNGDPDPWIRKSYTTIEAQSATMESFADALEEIAEAEWPVDDAVARIKRLASRVLATKGGVSDPEARD